jgi:hypothetical protein
MSSFIQIDVKQFLKDFIKSGILKRNPLAICPWDENLILLGSNGSKLQYIKKYDDLIKNEQIQAILIEVDFLVDLQQNGFTSSDRISVTVLKNGTCFVNGLYKEYGEPIKKLVYGCKLENLIFFKEDNLDGFQIDKIGGTADYRKRNFVVKTSQRVTTIDHILLNKTPLEESLVEVLTAENTWVDIYKLSKTVKSSLVLVKMVLLKLVVEDVVSVDKSGRNAIILNPENRDIIKALSELEHEVRHSPRTEKASSFANPIDTYLSKLSVEEKLSVFTVLLPKLNEVELGFLLHKTLNNNLDLLQVCMDHK